MWHRVEDELQSIWDNGELMIGYGEFAENNKPLVPSGYEADWFASDLLETLVIRNRKWIASHKSWASIAVDCHLEYLRRDRLVTRMDHWNSTVGNACGTEPYRE